MRHSATRAVDVCPHFLWIPLAFALRISRCGLQPPISDYEFRFVNPASAPAIVSHDPLRYYQGRFTHVEETNGNAPDPDPVISDRPVQIQVLATSMTIHALSIERASIVGYLKTIEPDKQAIALIRALEVGVIEMLARRERFRG